MGIFNLFKRETDRARLLGEAYIVPDPVRCVQCGVCNQNCPAGIDVRRHSWMGKSVHDGHCLTCGMCVSTCPRGALGFERLAFFEEKSTQTEGC